MTTTPVPQSDARAEIEAHLRDYIPKALDPKIWDAIREEAMSLALDAGPLRRLRARKDLEAIADVAEHLSRSREPVTLERILEDKTLPAFDSAQARAGAGGGTRENKRGRLRRLQAAHRGLPWRRERRGDGQRIASLVQLEVVERVLRLLPGDGVAGRTGPRAVQAALDDARRRRCGLAADGMDPRVWAAARAHARSQGGHLTMRDLDAVVAYEVLSEEAPAVSLMVASRLTRRDIDHALVLADRLPEQPGAATAALLRG